MALSPLICFYQIFIYNVLDIGDRGSQEIRSIKLVWKIFLSSMLQKASSAEKSQTKFNSLDHRRSSTVTKPASIQVGFTSISARFQRDYVEYVDNYFSIGLQETNLAFCLSQCKMYSAEHLRRIPLKILQRGPMAYQPRIFLVCSPHHSI